MFSRTKIFTAHTKADRKDPSENVVLVEEGFSYLAALFTLFWLLFNRLWVEALGFLVLVAALDYVTRLYALDSALMILGDLFLSLLLGYAAFDLKRKALDRRGYAFARVVVAENALNAERRYYDAMA